MKNICNLKKYTKCLTDLAFDPINTKGRKSKDIDDYSNCIDPFISDIQKISKSKSIRLLQHKTQVFTLLDNDLYRNRMVHTLEVTSTAKILANALGLNENLSEAVALGHDIGHTLFGHCGEQMISKIAGKPFSHAKFGAIVAMEIERKGKGLNLCYETLKGIIKHSSADKDILLGRTVIQEFLVVLLADKISYLFADANDFLDLKELKFDKKSFKKILKLFGENQRERENLFVQDILKSSYNKGYVTMSDELLGRLNEFKLYMYNNFYDQLNDDGQKKIIVNIYEKLQDQKENIHCDPLLFLTLCTDKDAVRILDKMYQRKNKDVFFENNIKKTSAYKILNRMEPNKRKKIDIFTPDFSWVK